MNNYNNDAAIEEKGVSTSYPAVSVSVSAPMAATSLSTEEPFPYIEEEFCNQQHFDHSYLIGQPQRQPQQQTTTVYTAQTAGAHSTTRSTACECCAGNHHRCQNGRSRGASSAFRSVLTSIGTALRQLFVTDEQLSREDALEQGIIQESRRIVRQEEDTLRREDELEREERRLAWAHIANLTNENAIVVAIQAEMDRSANAFKKSSERLQERARQREASRAEVTQYRRQRYLSAMLRTLSFAATAAFTVHVVRSSLSAQTAKPVSRRSVTNGNNNSMAARALATSPREQPSSQSASSSSSSTRGRFRETTENHHWWGNCHRDRRESSW